MNILEVYQVFNPEVPSGVAKVAYDVSKSLVNRGHKVVFYASDMDDWKSRGKKGAFVVDGIKVHRFRTIGTMLSSKLKIYITPSLVTLTDELSEFAVIHLHGYISFQCIVLRYYAKKYGIPYVLQTHGSLPKIGPWRSLKLIYDFLFGYRLLKDASMVIALNDVEVEQYKNFGVPTSKITVVPNGLDLCMYKNLPPSGVFKKKYGIKSNDQIILYLGRINKLKGIDFLIRSFAGMMNKGSANSKLVICGPDDGYLDEAKLLVFSLGISDFVLFTGMLSENDKISAYVDSSVCAYLSPSEPFGLVTLEAAACGTPVIISKGTPMENIVNEGKFGFSVKYGDICELAETMRRLFNDSYLLKEMSQKGRKFVFNNFNWNDKVVELEKVYSTVVSSNARFDH